MQPLALAWPSFLIRAIFVPPPSVLTAGICSQDTMNELLRFGSGVWSTCETKRAPASIATYPAMNGPVGYQNNLIGKPAPTCRLSTEPPLARRPHIIKISLLLRDPFANCKIDADWKDDLGRYPEWSGCMRHCAGWPPGRCRRLRDRSFSFDQCR